MKYSVLMSVYWKEKAEYLKQAIGSIENQSVRTDDFVLVCDGKLTEELNKVIAEKEIQLKGILHVIRLSENVGLGNALNIGINFCKNELIARMDSDDIAFEDRCEKQLKVFLDNPNISICSGTVEEFSEDINVVDTRRILPEKQRDILEFAKKRNPFNHPCVMYKKSSIEAVGSYQDFYLLEDYYLWIRLLMGGYEGYNIQSSLLHMRAGSEMYKRRAGMKYAKSQMKLFAYMKDQNFISNSQFFKSCVLRCGSALAPNCLRRFMFEKILRK